MALQDLKGGMWFPAKIATDGVPAFANITLDTASETGWFIFKAPKTGSIDRVIYSLGAVSITAGPLNFDARLETVDAATGLPSGTLWAANTNGADSIADTDDNDQREITLTASASVTKGQDVAFVLTAPGSGTFSVVLQSIGGDLVSHFPYCGNGTTKLSRIPVFGVRYSTPEYIAPVGCVPIETYGSSTIGSASNPDEVGNKFTFPFPCKVNGINIWMDPAATTDFTVKIYQGDSTELLSHTIDSDVHATQTDGSYEFDLDDTISLSANTAYRVTLLPNTTAQEFHFFTVESASYMDMHDGGQSIFACVRQDAGAWDDTNTTRRYFISLRICALDDGVGGGGGTKTMLVFH